MCIINDDCAVVKNGRLKLWKVIKADDSVGLWHETTSMIGELDSFHVGELTAHDYTPEGENLSVPGAFHCFFTREAARKYLEYRAPYSWPKLKIIKVYANSQDVVSVGMEKYSDLYAISVSKMTIKSLKHQR